MDVMNSSGVIAQGQYIQSILNQLTILNLYGYMWPKQACVKDGDTFDFIIVGAGTAGCVIANRLIEMGNVSVLLVEAGDNPPVESGMPGLLTYMRRTKYDWNFTSTCQSDPISSQREGGLQMTQGKMVGGSGSLNYVGYARGNQHDFAQWEKLTKDPTWSWESVRPTFNKNEKLTDNIILNSPDKCFYGTDGNMKIMKQYFKRNDDYFSTFKELGWDSPLDINPNTPLGFTNFMENVGDDERQSTAVSFLSPIKDNPNLHVLINTLVTKIIFDKHKRAIGVKMYTSDKKIIFAKARKEVIVSAGVMKSPQLLMLSGIGPKYHLKSKGIKLIANLPVGQNFQDHVNAILAYKMTDANRGTRVEDPHKYPFSIFEGHVALNESQGYPDYEVIGVSFGEVKTFLEVCAFYFNLNGQVCDYFGKSFENSEALLVFITYLYPKSRGEIRLASKNPHESPIIIPGYYTNHHDVVTHAKYVRDFNRVLTTSYFKKVKAKLIIPELENCKQFKEGSAEFWECYTVSVSDTAHYYVGTCGMGCVLDSRLRVRKVKSLRVADASAFPTTIGAYTLATVVMLAQKAAEFIKEEHCL